VNDTNEARKKVRSGRQAIEFLLLHGKREWKTWELQAAAKEQFGYFMSESSVGRYCRDFCHSAIPPMPGQKQTAFTYIHIAR